MGLKEAASTLKLLPSQYVLGVNKCQHFSSKYRNLMSCSHWNAAHGIRAASSCTNETCSRGGSQFVMIQTVIHSVTDGWICTEKVNYWPPWTLLSSPSSELVNSFLLTELQLSHSARRGERKVQSHVFLNWNLSLAPPLVLLLKNSLHQELEQLIWEWQLGLTVKWNEGAPAAAHS